MQKHCRVHAHSTHLKNHFFGNEIKQPLFRFICLKLICSFTNYKSFYTNTHIDVNNVAIVVNYVSTESCSVTFERLDFLIKLTKNLFPFFVLFSWKHVVTSYYCINIFSSKDSVSMHAQMYR